VFDGLTAARLDRIRPRLPDLRRLIAVDEAALDVPGALASAALEERAADACTPVETHPHDPAQIMYTSGTTGPPKGAVLPHAALIGHLPAFVLFNNLAPRPGDRLWSPADWAWIGGLFNVLWAGWHYGIPVVAFRQPKFDPERAFWVLERHQIRNTFLFPTALKLMRQAHARGPRAAVRLRDPGMFLEYWNNPEATRQKFAGDWAVMGDLAVKDADGYLWFKARKDDMIKSGGYRIGPGEVEECLLRHPAVAMAAVVGIPDPERGQVVKAFVRLAAGAAPPGGPASRPVARLTAELQQMVKDRVGFHAYPRSIEFVDELPLTTTGKVQ